MIGCNSSSSEEFVRSLDAEPELFEREFIASGSMTSFQLSDPNQVYNPTTLAFKNDRFYVSDFSDFSIYEYDLTGEKLAVIKTGRGRGPGEFTNLTGYDVKDNIVWAVDSQNMKISSFDFETGEFLSEISVDRRPVRIACLSDGFIVQWFGTEKLFSKFDYDGNEIRQFGEIIEDQRQQLATLDGKIISNNEDRFIYVPFYSSLIYHYKADGDLINILKSPDGLEFPITRREGARFSAPEHQFMRDGIFTDDNNLYVYSLLPGAQRNGDEWSGEPRAVIDKFSLTDAEYKHSIELDLPYRRALFFGGGIYGVTDDAETYISLFEEKLSF